MKKLIVAAAALLISVSSFAQFGIIAGLTTSATTLKDAQLQLETKTIAQYHVGVTYKFALGNVLAIQPSLIYNMKGARLAEFSTSSLDLKAGYLELPVQVQAGIGLGSLARIYAIAEPFVGYAVSNKIEGNNLQEKWENVSKKFEYGIGLGAGVELFSHLQVSVRYYWNLDDFTMQKIQGAIKGKCNGITASVAYIF